MASQANGLYEFGSYRLNAAKRLLTRGGEAVALPPKAFDLLLLLLESDGRVLSKNELLDALWPDTFVEEANLTFQISTLRKMLGDPAAGWIETVPKHGYRFTAPVVLQPPGLRMRRWWTAAVLVAVVAAGGLFLVKRPANRGIPPTAVPLTTYPGMEMHPSLSPDGSRVAFAWDGPNEDNFDIYVKLVGPGEPLRLTSDPAPEFSPSWSPDGRWIAFLRGPLQGVIGIYVIPALGGAAERKITEILQPTAAFVERNMVPNANLTWTPDSKWLAVIGVRNMGEETALWLVSAETGEMRQLTEPPQGWLGDFGPAFSSTGRMLAFVRLRTLAVGELHVLPVSDSYEPAGPSRILASSSLSMEAPAWTPDSRELLFSSGPPLGTRRLNRLSVTGAAGEQEVLAVGEDGTTLSVAPSGTIVYSRLWRDTNIWALDLDRPGSPPQLLIASTRDDYGPDYSPDGRKIAFASTRSGAGEIWMADADGSNPVQLTNVGGPHTSNPRWSPDGATILFDSRMAGAAHIYLLHPSTRQIRRLTSEQWHENEARWSRDGKWIYYLSGRTGQGEVWRAPRDGGDTVQVTRQGGFNARESADGRYLYFSRKGSPFSLWRRPVAGGEAVKIADGLSASDNFDVAEQGVYFIGERGPKRIACLRYYDAPTGKINELLDTGKHWWYGVAVSPDGRRLLYSVVDSRGSDLMVAGGVL